MSEKLKIKISIADRIYPLTIDPKQEQALRAASKKIDETIKQFEENYAVRDKQDVLAMCALQFASQSEQTGLNTLHESKANKDKLDELNRLIDNFI
ncbi:MAG: cell division protein ZapA [Flavobacteriales bacterium]|nr:cell division protein ZapA [Flavobacteriales bacterium]